jgi:pyruvate formate lyase activating enzyme
MKAHARSRADHGLPIQPPRGPEGLACNLCVHECHIPEGQTGYCGVRTSIGGKLTGATPSEGKLSWYHDPLPTNCVADWVCPGGTGAGYPRFAHCRGPESGFENLAVFFHACTFNCLFCQNWQYRLGTQRPRTTPVAALVDDVGERTACICYFGGDPAPQLPFSIRASRMAREKKKDAILRLCWETNGSMQERLLDEMVDLAIESGGCIKFDLKAWDENLHIALTGVTNRRTLENFTRAAGSRKSRRIPPLLVASTLLVPGYIDEQEVGKVAEFIASIDRDIPYSLLAFHPHFRMADLERTPGSLARRCFQAAKDAGLERVRMGNVHLLDDEAVGSDFE